MKVKKRKDRYNALQYIQRSRTNMAMLHFIMLAPKWSLSLFLFLAARHKPIPTTQDAVKLPIQRMKAAYNMESRAYQQCAIDSVLSLQTELQTKAHEEFQRVSKLQQLNRNTIDHARKKKDQCYVSAKNSQSLLLQWQDQGNTVDLVDDAEICSPEKQANVDELLGGDSKLREGEVTSVWDQHFQETLRGYQLIQDYAEKRFQYDYNYFVGLHIQPALNLIGTFPNIDSLHLSVDDLAIKDRINAALQRLQEVLHRAEVAMTALKERIAQLSTSLQAFYNAYLDCYDRLVRGVLFVQDILPPGVAMPGFFNVEGLPIADAMMPALPDIAIFDVNFFSAYLLFNETGDLCMKIIQDVVSDLIAQSEQALRGAMNKISEELIDVLTLEDYNPPVFVGSQGAVSSLSDELAFQQNISRSALEQSKLLLANLTAVKVPTEDTPRSFVAVESPTDTFHDPSTSFEYLNPIFPNIVFPKILSYLLSLLSSYTWLIEVTIQAIRLWRLEVTYSTAAIPDLPEITYINDNDKPSDHDEKQSKTQQLFLLTIIRNLMSPRVVLAIILTPLVLGGIALWYPHVQTNCQETRDGTFLANRFLAPIFINDANTNGNAYYLMAEFQCYNTEREICRQMQAQTFSQYQIDQATFLDLQSDYNKSTHVIQILQDCISTNTSTTIADSCCGLKGQAPCTETSNPGFCPVDDTTLPDWPMAYRPIKEYWADSACQTDEKTLLSDLVEPKFECEALSRICQEIPCHGVDKVALRKETVETDCEVELYALDCFVFILWTVFHAVTMHIVSTLLFNGVRTLGWRRLHAEGIVLHTKMMEDGTLVNGNDQQERAERIARAIRRFELAGKLQIAVGLCVFLVWAIIVVR